MAEKTSKPEMPASGPTRLTICCNRAITEEERRALDGIIKAIIGGVTIFTNYRISADTTERSMEGSAGYTVRFRTILLDKSWRTAGKWLPQKLTWDEPLRGLLKDVTEITVVALES